MSLWKRGRQYWTDFTVAGRRYRKRLGTTNLRVATRRERELVEEAGHGRLAADNPSCSATLLSVSAVSVRDLSTTLVAIDSALMTTLPCGWVR
jgi:hypothetical protein